MNLDQKLNRKKCSNVQTNLRSSMQCFMHTFFLKKYIPLPHSYIQIYIQRYLEIIIQNLNNVLTPKISCNALDTGHPALRSE